MYSRPQSKVLSWALPLGAACLCEINLLAASTNDAQHVASTNLQPVVVRASRGHRAPHELPVGVTVIQSEDIQRIGARDTVQLLEKGAGLYLRKLSGNPSQAEVVMRGFGENAHGRVLVLVDGQPLNEPDMAAPNWMRVPIDTIERVEILYGSQTALYGNYAVAGVINLVTRRGGAEPLTSFTVTAGSDDSYGTHLRKSGTLGEATSYAADLDWQKSGGWRDNAHYESWDARIALDHDWTERLVSSLSTYYNWNTSGLPGWLYGWQMEADPRQSGMLDDHAESESWGFNMGSEGETIDWGTFSFNLVGQRRLRQGTYFSRFSDNSYAINSFELSPKYELDGTLGGQRNLLLAGIDAGADQLAYYKTALPGNWSVPASTRMSDTTLRRVHAALYGQNEFFLDESLSVVVGLRGEALRNGLSGRALNGLSVDESLSGSSTYWQYAADGAVLFRPEKDQKYYFRASRLYRFPFLDEMAGYQNYGANGLNANLEPEKGWQLEAGLAVELVEDIAFDLRGYRLVMTDEIGWQGNWLNGRNYNMDETTRYGLESGLRWSPGTYGSYGLSYQLVDARFSDGPNDENRVPLVPAQVLSLDAEVPVVAGISLLGALRGVGSQYLGSDVANEGAKIKEYIVFDAGVRYEPQFALLSQAYLLLQCDNIFDHRYANVGYYDPYGLLYGYDPTSYYPANGRTWRVTVGYAF